MNKPALCTLIIALLVLSPCHSRADEILVSAATSLANAFNEIGPAYTKQHPQTVVRFNFAASGSLQQQIEQGAPVDVFASASPKEMDALHKKGRIEANTRADFAGNHLVLIAPLQSPLKQWGDLLHPTLEHIALSSPESVPSGRYAKETLIKRGLWTAIQPKVVFGESVRQTLAYVLNGDAGAGVVFSTDAQLEKSRVRVVQQALPGRDHALIVYPVAVVKGAQNVLVARSFTVFLKSPTAQAILARYGFTSPFPSQKQEAPLMEAGSTDWSPLWLSLQVAGFATLLVLPVGILVSWWLAHGRPFPGKTLLETLLALPLVLPPTVVGFYLLMVFGQGTALGQWVNERGLHLVFTWQGAALAAAVMALPLFIRTASAAFAAVEPELLEAGRTLGAGERELLIWVIVPMAYRGVFAGLALAFARALGEFGATLMVAGSIPSRTQTLPLALYASVQAGRNEEAWRYTLLLSITAFLVLSCVGAYQRRVSTRRGER
ncbi:MAG: molybdate ABC transporter permease subunit [Armatimonadetes bacterium]|nr:molybdate ABC transporter permease subunit [Armatimonadota bacterium]